MTPGASSARTVAQKPKEATQIPRPPVSPVKVSNINIHSNGTELRPVQSTTPASSTQSGLVEERKLTNDESLTKEAYGQSDIIKNENKMENIPLVNILNIIQKSNKIDENAKNDIALNKQTEENSGVSINVKKEFKFNFVIDEKNSIITILNANTNFNKYRIDIIPPQKMFMGDIVRKKKRLKIKIRKKRKKKKGRITKEPKRRYPRTTPRNEVVIRNPSKRLKSAHQENGAQIEIPQVNGGTLD